MTLLLVGLFVLLPLTVHAQYSGDPSGEAMQRFDSQMHASPWMRFPSLLRRSFFPMISYFPAPPTTVVNIQIQIPELERPPMPPPHPPAPAKFWTIRCGVFVELDASPAMNLMEEEKKPCTQ